MQLYTYHKIIITAMSHHSYLIISTIINYRTTTSSFANVVHNTSLFDHIT